MSAFSYRDGVLHAEAVPLPTIANAVGTPLYCYSKAALSRAWGQAAEAFAGLDVTIAYAVKANPNLAVIGVFAGLGAGADVVSLGELKRALKAGVPAQRIVFSGVGKAPDEIAAALEAGIHQINIESEPELGVLAAAAQATGRRAQMAIRVNPDVDAGTHAKITTGRKENKFGVDLEQAGRLYREAARLPGIEPVGLAVHLGSQLTDLTPYRVAFERLAGMVRSLRADGLAVTRLDLGGGLGVAYRDEEPPGWADYAALVRELIAPLGTHITIEPGRRLVAEAGLMLGRVLYVKRGLARDFLILDAAMNDLIRPALYDAWHEILPVTAPNTGLVRYDVVGPVCESGDTFAVQRPLPAQSPGALVAFMTAGAYGAAMASTYNSRALVPEVLVEGGRFAVVRKRPTFEESVALETAPDWVST